MKPETEAEYPIPETSRSLFKEKFDKWLLTKGLRAIVHILWTLVHVVLFCYGIYLYQKNIHFTQARNKIGITFAIAKASAFCIHIDTIFILIPVCRNLLTFLQSTMLNNFVRFDKNVEFHKTTGTTLAIFSLIHSVAHYYNFFILGKYKQTFHNLLFLSGAGASGHIMLLCLVFICLFAIERIRRKWFELFWYSHHLFGLYFMMFSMHGSFCVIKPDNPDRCSEGGQFYKYYLVGGFLYLSERIIKEYRTFKNNATIKKVILHPSNVVELQITKKRENPIPGQYILLCVPQLSSNEWHPFTLTSAPQEDYNSVHIRVVGDFTRKLKELLIKNKKLNLKMPRVILDGPFGCASENVFRFETAVLVGAGIGVTPFASVLKSIWYKIHNQNLKNNIKLKKVYFIWVCRDREAFEWFMDLLIALEHEDIDEFIEIHIHLTSKKEKEKTAPNTLRTQLKYGRPNLDKLFAMLCYNHKHSKVGIFFCGPKPLSKQLEHRCNMYTQPISKGVSFYFGKENF